MVYMSRYPLDEHGAQALNAVQTIALTEFENVPAPNRYGWLLLQIDGFGENISVSERKLYAIDTTDLRIRALCAFYCDDSKTNTRRKGHIFLSSGCYCNSNVTFQAAIQAAIGSLCERAINTCRPFRRLLRQPQR